MMSPQYLDEMVDDNEEIDYITEEEEVVVKEQAVLAWLWTFPQVHNSIDEGVLMRDWASYGNGNGAATRAIHHAAADICDRTVNSETTQSSTDSWEAIADWVECERPFFDGKMPSPAQAQQSVTQILSALLCYAIDEMCPQRNTYIGRIMGLQKNVQRTLMQLIKDFNDHKMESMSMNMTTPYKEAGKEPHPDESYLDDLNIDDDNESLLDDDEHAVQFEKENVSLFHESFSSPTDVGVKPPSREPLSPRFQSPMAPNNRITNIGQFSRSSTKKLAPPPHSASSRNISARKVITLERDNTILNERNQELQRDIEMIRHQENVMRVRCEESERINRAARLKLESEALMRESEIRDECSLKILDMERELKKLQKGAKEGASVKEQFASLQDEVDILKHSKMQLEQKENQLQKLKIKMEKMSDISKTLEHEEKAHSDTLSKCFELENELATLGPLRRQLEDYKSRATNAEVRLVDCEDEIKKLKEAGDNMCGLNDELQRGSLRQQEEAEHLRRTLEKNELDTPDGMAVGEGMSELNPSLKEELLRLRSENARLKAFAAKREDDSVQKLEERLDDSNRIADKFKEQYLSTKATLETSQRDLMSALKREQQLEKRISDSDDLNRELKQTLQDERISAQKAKLEATRTLHTARRELNEQAKSDKDIIVLEWKARLEEQQLKSEEKYIILENNAKDNEGTLNNTIAQLHQQSVESLKKVETEFLDKTKKLEKANQVLERNSAEELQQMQQESVSSLQKVNSDFSEKMKSIEEDHREEIDRIKLKNEEERSKLIHHGKQLVQKKEQNANIKIQNLEQQNADSLSRYEKLCDAQKDFETRVNAKIQSYRQRLNLSEATVEETAKECDDLQTKVKKLERENSTLQSENDRCRRQLGGRFDSDSGQYEELQRNYNDLLNENRVLKEKIGNNTPTSDLANSFSFASSSQPYTTGTSISASSLSQLRAEYEEKIEEINDDKRELVMKNSSLITDEKKVQKRAWELEVEVKKLHNLNTSLKLQLERASQSHPTLKSPVTSGKRRSSKLTPSSIGSKASRMWKGAKLSRKAKTSLENADGTPTSIEPMIEFTSPEFQKSVKNLKNKGDVDGFKNKLIQRLSAKKKKSPLKSMSLMDMAAVGNKKLEF